MASNNRFEGDPHVESVLFIECGEFCRHQTYFCLLNHLSLSTRNLLSSAAQVSATTPMVKMQQKLLVSKQFSGLILLESKNL
jgi:hypothetical protein